MFEAQFPLGEATAIPAQTSSLLRPPLYWPQISGPEFEGASAKFLTASPAKLT